MRPVIYTFSMNEIIKRIDIILSSDGWKRTAMLQILRDELCEKRDAALKAKETSRETLKVEIKDGEVKTDWAETLKPGYKVTEDGSILPSEEEMIEEGKTLVAGFDNNATMNL